MRTSKLWRARNRWYRTGGEVRVLPDAKPMTNESPERDPPSKSDGTPTTSADPARLTVSLDGIVLGCALGFLGGFTLFATTAWLVVKGGESVGPHLGLLGQFFPGYSVTWRGSFIGFLYGFACGGAGGWIIATVYNWVAERRR